MNWQQWYWMNLWISEKKGWEVKSVSYNKLSSGLLHSSLYPRTASYRKIWRKRKSIYWPTISFPPVTRSLRSGIVVVIRPGSIRDLGCVWDSYKPSRKSMSGKLLASSSQAGYFERKRSLRIECFVVFIIHPYIHNVLIDVRGCLDLLISACSWRGSRGWVLTGSSGCCGTGRSRNRQPDIKILNKKSIN